MKKHTPLKESREVLEQMSETILKTFANFGLEMKVVHAQGGLRAYHFELEMITPTRMKTISTFVDDLRYALGTNSVEIEAPIADKKLIGIRVVKPVERIDIPLTESLRHDDYPSSGTLTVPLGVGEFGDPVELDIAQAPHILIGGTTGSGKSVLIHSIINSLIEKNTPYKLRLILADPKRTDLTVYKNLPHLLTPVITQPKPMVRALGWAIKEMARRYDIIVAEEIKDIYYYHKQVYEPMVEKWQKQGSDLELRDELPESLPYIVIIIDEMNDMMQAYPKEMEACLVRLAQMSRAVGIHLILATQRPSVNVVTGTIKANIPTRIALSVASQVDSRTIIDQAGAEKLVGNGDMLYLGSDFSKLHHLQGYSITDEEIKRRVEKLSISTNNVIIHDLDLSDSGYNSFVHALGEEVETEDDLYEDAKKAVIEAKMASTSFLQRKLRIGYSRSARLIDLLEETGVIGMADGARPREILIKK